MMSADGTLVLDASAVIALENPEHPLRDSVLSVLDDAVSVLWLLHPVTAAELLVGPAADGDEGTSAYRAWLDELGVSIARAEVIADLSDDELIDDLACLRARTGVKLPDCMALHCAKMEHATLVTGDRRLARAARDEGVEVIELTALRGDGSAPAAPPSGCRSPGPR